MTKRKKFNKARTIELHDDLWDWCSRNPTKEKSDWPEWKKNGGKIPEVECECFLCEWVRDSYKESCVEKCPLKWSSKNGRCNSLDGEFHMWENAKTLKLKRKYARLIRDLPER
ncbi:MAG: hypothetical protein FVQ80_06910 [Planctomycetes bacterium]|nr:hypothetical protein [Planctomycetota bacterium]